MGIELRLLGADGEQAQALPDVESLTLSPMLCDAGAIEFQYPVAGINASHIVGRDEFELAVYLDGIRRPELDAIVKDVDGDDIEEDGVWKFTGFFNNGRLDEAITYPANWPDVDPEKPNLIFTSATAGTIVGTLMQQAKSRGTLLDIDYSSFSTTHDSNGVEWTLTISLEFVPQVSYLDVLKNLYEQGLCEWQMVGKSLRLYVRDSMAEDRTLQDPPLVFRKGRDLADSPRKRSTRELATAYLTAGAQGLYHEAVNGAAVAARRRIEGGSSQGNVSDRGTLIAYTDAQLQRVSTPKMEKTHGLEFADEDTPRPMRHFDVGDWAYTDTGSGLERLRIKQWVIKNNADGSLSGSVTMNDFFAEQDEKTAKRVSGIIGGSTIAGGSRAEARMPADAANGLRPAQVGGLTAQSAAYIDASGQTLAQVTASWQQVTTNEDGTVLDDLGRYLVEYQQPTLHGEDTWVRVDAGTATTRSWSPVAAGEETRVRVRAEDKWGNVGEWSDPQVIESGADAVPPPVPTAPTVDNYLGLLRVRWDGTFLNGQARPFDFARVDVHVSDVNYFEPTEATLAGPLSTAGSVFVDVPYGEVRYARLVAYDATGNGSDPSDLGEGTSSQVVSADIFEGAVGSLQLADLAVTSAKINLLAVNSAQVGTIEVGKLIAGTMTAEVIMGGRIATAASGARVELNSLGIFRWNAAGDLMVRIDNDGALLTGLYRTALTGRRIEMGAADNSGRIDFWSPDGKNGWIRAFTATQGDVGVEAIQMGVRPFPDPGNIWNGWNAIQFEADESVWTQTAGHMTLIGGGPGAGSEGSYQGWQLRWAYDRGQGIEGGTTPRSVYTNSVARAYVYETGESHYLPPGGGYYLQERAVANDPNSTLWNPYDYAAGLHVFRSGSARGRLSILNGDTNSSPHLRFTNSPGYGAMLKFYGDGDGSGAQRLEARVWNDSAFAPIHASAFTVGSDGETKNDVVLAERAGLLDAIRATPVKKYRRKERERLVQEVEAEDGEDVVVDQHGDRQNQAEKDKPQRRRPAKSKVVTVEAPEEIGLIAQEAPAQIVSAPGSDGTLGIDLYQMAAMTWGGLAEEAELREQLGVRLDELVAAVAALAKGKKP